MSEYKLDSVAQNRSLGQPVSLDEMSRRAEEISNSLQPKVEILQAVPPKKKTRTLDTRFRNSQSQIDTLEKEGN